MQPVKCSQSSAVQLGPREHVLSIVQSCCADWSARVAQLESSQRQVSGAESAANQKPGTSQRLGGSSEGAANQNPEAAPLKRALDQALREKVGTSLFLFKRLNAYTQLQVGTVHETHSRRKTDTRGANRNYFVPHRQRTGRSPVPHRQKTGCSPVPYRGNAALEQYPPRGLPPLTAWTNRRPR
eukprot:1515-Prorocentrum_minimum.AAC.3